MYLIQLLLPLRDNKKTPFARLDFDTVRSDRALRGALQLTYNPQEKGCGKKTTIR